jgi:hypothetical protein
VRKAQFLTCHQGVPGLFLRANGVSDNSIREGVSALGTSSIKHFKQHFALRTIIDCRVSIDLEGYSAREVATARVGFQHEGVRYQIGRSHGHWTLEMQGPCMYGTFRQACHRLNFRRTTFADSRPARLVNFKSISERWTNLWQFEMT